MTVTLVVICGTSTTQIPFENAQSAEVEFEALKAAWRENHDYHEINSGQNRILVPLQAITTVILQYPRPPWLIEHYADQMIEQAKIQQIAQRKAAGGIVVPPAGMTT